MLFLLLSPQCLFYSWTAWQTITHWLAAASICHSIVNHSPSAFRVRNPLWIYACKHTFSGARDRLFRSTVEKSRPSSSAPCEHGQVLGHKVFITLSVKILASFKTVRVNFAEQAKMQIEVHTYYIYIRWRACQNYKMQLFLITDMKDSCPILSHKMGVLTICCNAVCCNLLAFWLLVNLPFNYILLFLFYFDDHELDVILALMLTSC